jgi:hypothetical protein
MVRLFPRSVSLFRSSASHLVALTVASFKRNAFRQALMDGSRLQNRSSHRSIVESLEPRHLMASVPFAIRDGRSVVLLAD